MVFQHVGRSARASAPDRDPAKDLIPGVCVIGTVTHLAFLMLFAYTGFPLLVAANVCSIAIYLIVLALELRTDTSPIVTFGLIGGELFGHALVATVVIGWDSGFHYYILLLVPVTAVGAIHPAWLKAVAVSSAGLGYVGLDLLLRSATPTHALSGTFIGLAYYFNLLSTMLILAGLALRYHSLINQTQATLRVMASTDPLTQLRNRESLTVLIRQQHSRAQRGHSLSFVMCDIDLFKAVNDRWGHAAGDAVLRFVSRSMAGSVREADYLGRWGGEEFLVVLPDADADTAAAVAERLRSEIASLPVLFQGGPPRITVTVGVATLEPGEAAAQAIARADGALYSGKRAGRNRVVAAVASASDWNAAPST